MVDAARRATDHLGFRNAQFEVASADRLADTFDAVVSRFGVMFFSSPIDGVREMLRVLKPGRKLALAVWHFAEKNLFHFASSIGLSIRHPLHPMLRTHSALPAQASYGSFLRGRRDVSMRAPVAVHNMSIDLSGGLLDTAMRVVREVS
jgi:ubiquinone/menaquinone biosynthesis C-methylase UbiE